MKYDFKHLLINGCSHSAGSEIEGSGIGEGDYNRAQCFGAQLARRLDCKYSNLAVPGGSNDYIARSTLYWILENQDLAKDTLFLIHWTGSTRTEFFYDGPVDKIYWNWIDYSFDKQVGHVHFDHHANIFPKTMNSNLQSIEKSLFINETHWEINKYNNIIQTQTLLKSLNLQYVFGNAFQACAQGERYQKYSNLIDRTKFKNPFDEKESFFENCLANGFSVEGQKYWHHKLEAHTYWTDRLFKENFS
jgi:hypothetical protein